MKSLHCLLGSHGDVLVVEPGRVYLRCTSCLRETTGWDVRVVGPREQLQLRAMLRGEPVPEPSR